MLHNVQFMYLILLLFYLFYYDENRCGLCFYLQDKSLSTGIFFLELLSSVHPRAVNWSLVTKGETGNFLLDLNRFLLPVIQVNILAWWCTK